MKQVIVRLRDCRTNRLKTIRKCYYYSQSQYREQVYDDFKDLMPGQEIWVKIGNQHSEFITYEEVLENSQMDDLTFDDELYYMLTNRYTIDYFLNDYLPHY